MPRTIVLAAAIAAFAIPSVALAATVKGTGDDDTLDRARRPPTPIFGKGGDDRITGLAGNDRVRGGRGDDEIDGGADDDRMPRRQGRGRGHGRRRRRPLTRATSTPTRSTAAPARTPSIADSATR